MALHILPLGDSITAPLDGGSGWRGIAAPFLAPAYAFVGSVTDRDGQHHEGHAGFTVRQLMDVGLPEIKALHPLFLLLLAGTNDLAQGRTPAQVEADLGALVANAQSDNPALQIRVGTLPPLPGADDKVNELNRRIRGSIPKIQINQFSPAPEIVDFAAELEPVYRAEGRTAILNGFVHPNARGNALMSRAVLRAFGRSIPAGLGGGGGEVVLPPVVITPDGGAPSKGANPALLAGGLALVAFGLFAALGRK